MRSSEITLPVACIKPNHSCLKMPTHHDSDDDGDDDDEDSNDGEGDDDDDVSDGGAKT